MKYDLCLYIYSYIYKWQVKHCQIINNKPVEVMQTLKPPPPDDQTQAMHFLFKLSSVMRHIRRVEFISDFLTTVQTRSGIIAHTERPFVFTFHVFKNIWGGGPSPYNGKTQLPPPSRKKKDSSTILQCAMCISFTYYWILTPGSGLSVLGTTTRRTKSHHLSWYFPTFLCWT